MTTAGKIIVFGSGALAVAGAAYYFLIYSKNKSNSAIAVQTIQSGIAAAKTSSGRSLTLADLQNRQWKNTEGLLINGAQHINAYDQSSGVVGNSDDSRWTGILLDANTISWTHSTGPTALWKAVTGVNGPDSRSLLN